MTTDTPSPNLLARFETGAAGALLDSQLLELFVDAQEASAFETIVRRHGPMVWGVCRRVLGHHHDAEDAFQATFLVLVRKAASVQPRDQVGSWLNGVAVQTARKVRATRGLRRSREAAVSEVSESAEPARSEGDERLARLDRELRHLPERYRVPIVLCELEGHSHREAAEQLGWPIGTVSGRLSRARELLARRMSRAGATAPAAARGSLLAREAVCRWAVSPAAPVPKP